MYDYDLIIIGAGAAGLTATFTALGFGKKVLVVEQAKPGGECTWSGCIPSKALIHLADRSHNRSPATDRPAMEQVREVIAKVYQEETPEKLKQAGADYVQGQAVFTDSHTIQVEGAGYSATNFIIATGSSPLVPPLAGIDDIQPLTNDNFFQQPELPKSLLVLGAGPIGIELAQACNRLGTSVTVVDMLPTILFREEPALSEMLFKHLQQEGLKFHLGLKVSSVAPSEKGVEMLLSGNGREITLQADQLLIAAGRRPNVENFGLEAIGVKTDNGIMVNRKMQTSLPHIYACGDVAGPYQFSHMANYQAKTATLNAILPFKRKVDNDLAIWVTYTDPEFARIGLTEAEARKKYGNKIRVYEYDFAKLDRCKTHPDEFGLMKLICDQKSRVLGAHILAPRAGELICEIQLLKQLGLPFSKLQSVVHPYPGYADSLRQLSQQVYLDNLQRNPLIKLVKKLKR